MIGGLSHPPSHPEKKSRSEVVHGVTIFSLGEDWFLPRANREKEVVGTSPTGGVATGKQKGAELLGAALSCPPCIV